MERVDALKGDLGRGLGTNRYPYIRADFSGPSEYPNWFGGTAEYLVFLRHESIEGTVSWVAMAAFAIEYQLDDAGAVVGLLSSDGPTVNVAEVRDSLRRLALDERLEETAALALDQLLRAAALSRNSPTVRDPVPFELRFEHVKKRRRPFLSERLTLLRGIRGHG